MKARVPKGPGSTSLRAPYPAFATGSMFVLTPLDRRGSPVEHVGDADRGRTSPKVDEQILTSEQIHRDPNSPYGSLGNAPEYSPLDQSTYPNSPVLYYNSLQPVNYNPQNQYTASSSFYPATTNGAYLGSAQPASAPAGGQSYSSYYPPVPTTQANWSPSNTESRDFIGLSGSYDQISDLPLEPSSLNADLFQFCEPDNPQ